MIFSRIAFRTEVPSPKAPSLARSNWIVTFETASYLIQRDGDVVYITDRVSGLQFLYPWSNVAAGELDCQATKRKASR